METSQVNRGFYGDFKLTARPDGRYQLSNENNSFFYSTGIGIAYCPEDRFVTDKKSVPILWRFLPDKSLILHDWLYMTRFVSKNDADMILRWSLEDEGVSTAMIYLTQLVIFMFGKRRYDKVLNFKRIADAVYSN